MKTKYDGRPVLSVDTVTEDEIRTAVHAIIEKEPNPEEIHQVAARLALVGWPLASAPAN